MDPTHSVGLPGKGNCVYGLKTGDLSDGEVVSGSGSVAGDETWGNYGEPATPSN